MPTTPPKPKRRRRRRKSAPKTRLSKMVTLRIKDTEALIAAVHIYGATIAEAVNNRLSPALLDGETLPDHRLTLELAARTVEHACDQLTELDDQHTFATADRDAAQARLVQITKQELYPQTVAVRRAIDAALGKKAGAKLHSFSGATPRNIEPLRKHVRKLLRRLQNPALRLPNPLPGETVNREVWLRRLDEPYRKLAANHRQLANCQNLFLVVTRERTAAMSHFDTLYTETLHLVDALFRLAGLSDKILKTLRPYYQRRRLSAQARKRRRSRADDAAVSQDSIPLTTSDVAADPDSILPETSDVAANMDSTLLKTSDVAANPDSIPPETSDVAANPDSILPDASVRDASAEPGTVESTRDNAS